MDHDDQAFLETPGPNLYPDEPSDEMVAESLAAMIGQMDNASLFMMEWSFKTKKWLGDPRYTGWRGWGAKGAAGCDSRSKYSRNKLASVARKMAQEVEDKHPGDGEIAQAVEDVVTVSGSLAMAEGLARLGMIEKRIEEEEQ